jgi:hypothetical protein
VGATDAGLMQIQLREGVSLRCAEAVLRSMVLHTAMAKSWLEAKKRGEDGD